jgi:hypothetical protein
LWSLEEITLAEGEAIKFFQGAQKLRGKCPYCKADSDFVVKGPQEGICIGERNILAICLSCGKDGIVATHGWG